MLFFQCEPTVVTHTAKVRRRSWRALSHLPRASMLREPWAWTLPLAGLSAASASTCLILLYFVD